MDHRERDRAENRKRCLEGAIALLAEADRRLNKYREDFLTGKIVFVWESIDGILRGEVSEKPGIVEEPVGSIDLDEAFSGVAEEIIKLATPGEHRAVSIEVWSTFGKLRAAKTFKRKYHWFGTN